jgi:acetolactate synthase I/II/III large subunit
MSDTFILEFARNLVASGISYAFGVTGGGASLRLIAALEALGIPYYPVAHEAAAALMAGACCRNGSTRAMAVGIKGPGFINFMPGILSNYYEGRPALTVSEAYSPSEPTYKKHKRLDHYSVCSSLVKAYARADSSREKIHSLLELSRTEFPGPVHIDMCNVPITGPIIHSEPEEATPDIGPHYIEKLLALIQTSNRPVVILGSMVSRRLRSFDWSSLTVPVLTTAAAKGCINETGQYSGGVITGEGKEISPEEKIVRQADLIVTFGLRNTEVVKAMRVEVPMVLLDMIGEDAHDGFEPTMTFVDKSLLSLAELVFAELTKKEWGREVVQKYWQLVREELLRDPWLPPAVFQTIEETGLRDPVLVLDTGLFCTVGEILWRASRPENFCGSSNGRFMGTAIPSAIGVAIASPDQDVVCVAGDGGIRPYLPEIKLAVDLHLPILIILMSDGQYGTIASSAENKLLSRNAYTIKSPTWWKAAQSIGCPSLRIENADALKLAIIEWFKNRGPLFIEVHFDPEKYSSLTRRLR